MTQIQLKDLTVKSFITTQGKARTIGGIPPWTEFKTCSSPSVCPE